MKRIIALLLTIMLFTGLCGGCRNYSNPVTELTPAVNEPTREPVSSTPGTNDLTADVPSEEPTASLTSTPEPTDELTSVPAPSEDSYRDEALRIAELHGLTEEDICGEYSLLVRFSETVEQNENVGDYREFLYRLFPVVAKNKDLIDEDFFFYRLGSLSIGVGTLDSDKRGQYFGNTVTLSENMLRGEPEKQYHTLFHELMHFLDYSLNGEIVPVSLLDGRHLTPADTAMLSNEEYLNIMNCKETNFVTEGGAELMTAKYFSGAPETYSDCVVFLTGIEYIMGENFFDEMFLRWDSDAIFYELFEEAGYSYEEYNLGVATLNNLSRPAMFAAPESPVAPEDMLIYLYEAKIGDGWREDGYFLYILKTLGGIDLGTFERSERSDFLKTVEFTWDSYVAFEERLLGGIAEKPEFMRRPPIPFIRDGRPLLGVYAVLTDPSTGLKYNGAITFDYDFDTETLNGYEIPDNATILSY